MNKLLIIGLGLLAAGVAWSQGSSSSNGQPPTPGAGTAVTSVPAGGSGVAIPQATFKAQCISGLAGFAGDKLKA